MAEWDVEQREQPGLKKRRRRRHDASTLRVRDFFFLESETSWIGHYDTAKLSFVSEQGGAVGLRGREGGREGGGQSAV